MDYIELAERLKQISKFLDEGKNLISEEKISEFQNSAMDIESRLEDIMKEGRLLRLGIVGEVKAGKSSFLNALLFDGKDVLPKAPTPMTAALTRIKYNEVPQAKVVFYNKNDWDAVKVNAQKYNDTLKKMYQEYCEKYDEMVKERSKKSFAAQFQNHDTLKKMYPESFAAQFQNQNNVSSVHAKKTIEEFEKDQRDNIPLEYSSCKELLDMTQSNALDVSRYLGEEEIIRGDGSDGVSFLKELDQYVGANGKFTSIVKYTELQMNNPMLEGIEVIDTPGLNDPIRSRGRTTQKFLLECDAVFLVGYCGQFLGADDMSLILSSLPDEGINKAVLIGSKFDSAILQYPAKKALSFETAYFGTKKNCEDQARENLNNCSVNSRNERLITQLRKSLPPMCVSSVAYSAARQMQDNEPLGKMEKFLVDRFNSIGYPTDVKTLLGLSNITDVKDSVFEETKAEKKAIISDRIATLVESQKGKFLGLLEDISIQVKNNQSDLKKYDLDQLEDRIESLKEKLDSVRIVVKSLFQNAGAESRRTIEDIIVDIGLEMKNHLDIEVLTSSETKHHSSTSGILFWKKTDHWDEIITTHTVEVNDVQDNITAYFDSCHNIINANFKKLLKIDQLKNSVKEAVLSAFEQNDRDFDENRIILPLEGALNRITIPQMSLDKQKYLEYLDSITVNITENGAVKNEHIPELKKAQNQAFLKVSNDIIEYLRQEAQNIDNSLQGESATFIDDIVGQLEENMKKVQDMLQNKQENLQKFDEFNEKLKECKNLIQG